jgi:transcriptional regulator with XRE-family HTH domain
MSRRTRWDEIKATETLCSPARRAYEDEAEISAFRDLVYRLRAEAGLTQQELGHRMGTTQSAIARIEGGGTRPTLETLRRLAAAVGADLVVGVGANLAADQTVTRLLREGRAVVSRA